MSPSTGSSARSARSSCVTKGPWCFYCGIALPTGPGPARASDQRPTDLTIDHIVPLCLGGGNNLANLCLCCRQCNRSKGARPWWEWAWPVDWMRPRPQTAA